MNINSTNSNTSDSSKGYKNENTYSNDNGSDTMFQQAMNTNDPVNMIPPSFRSTINSGRDGNGNGNLFADDPLVNDAFGNDLIPISSPMLASNSLADNSRSPGPGTSSRVGNNMGNSINSPYYPNLYNGVLDDYGNRDKISELNLGNDLDAAEDKNERTSKRDVKYGSNSNNSNQPKSRPAFVMKLWLMVNDESNSQFIKWSDDGKSFKVLNREAFMRNILPKYFKHSNFSSFVRQLNMYGWHKKQDLTANSIQSSLNNGSNEGEIWQFESPFFQRGREDLLDKIVRHRSSKNSKSEDEDFSINNVVSELNRIKSNQSMIAQDLRRVCKDNGLLWQEIFLTREKYNKQNETLNTILRFIASILQNNPNGNVKEIGFDGNNMGGQNSILSSLYDLNNRGLTNGNSMNNYNNGSNEASQLTNNRNLGNGNGTFDPRAVDNANNGGINGYNSNQENGTNGDYYTERPRLMLMNGNNDQYVASSPASIRTYHSSDSPSNNGMVLSNGLGENIGEGGGGLSGSIQAFKHDDQESEYDTLNGELKGEIRRAPENNNDNFVIPGDNFRRSSKSNGPLNNSAQIISNKPMQLMNGKYVPNGSGPPSATSTPVAAQSPMLSDIGSPSNISVISNALLANNENGNAALSKIADPDLERITESVNKQGHSIDTLSELINRYIPQYEGGMQGQGSDFNVDDFLNSKNTPSMPGTPLSAGMNDIADNSMGSKHSLDVIDEVIPSKKTKLR